MSQIGCALYGTFSVSLQNAPIPFSSGPDWKLKRSPRLLSCGRETGKRLGIMEGRGKGKKKKEGVEGREGKEPKEKTEGSCSVFNS